MTTLITGGAGYIGSHGVFELLDRGNSVIVVDNLSTGFREALPRAVPFFVADVGDESFMSKLMMEHGVTAVLHFAASTVVPDSVADPINYYKNNAANSLALLSACVRARVKFFILSSTAAVYGNPDDSIIGEKAICRPMSPYGTSKLMTEAMLRDVALAHQMKYVILRYFNVAGADPALRTGQSTRAASHLIKVAVQVAMGMRDKLEIFGTDYPTPDGTGIRDYIHVSDLANAHVRALEYLRSGGESVTLNCGYGHGCSVRQVIETVKRVSGVDFAVAERSRRPGDPASVVADVRAIRDVLGWNSRHDDLDAIVRHALAWETKLAAKT